MRKKGDFCERGQQETGASVDILRTRGDTVRFGLRTKVVFFPEDICAVWVMLAVKYREVL